ncbi:MAG: hypothetical protein B5M48_01650 [Candidatus Omnitrophica bacterium 4484_213]|nr:MAG: hypothetical protein B5M48_01650 [Candidatus Omnitrophica bacterium 4484_213]
MHSCRFSEKKSFTLIEISVSLVVFGLVMAAAAGALCGIYNDWRRQRNYVECIENARWAMEFMGNEVRQGGNVVVGSELWGAESVDRLQFEVPPGGAPNRVRYFRGNNGAFGPTRTLYRKSGAGLGPPADRQELANFIVDNPNFNWDAAVGVLTIELTVRPRPSDPEGRDNRNYTLRTQVRPRNQ